METTFLISHARTGSQLVQMSLARHPGLTSWGEVLCSSGIGYTPEMRQLVYAYCKYEVPEEDGPVMNRLYSTVAYLEMVEKKVDFCKLLYSHITPEIHEWLQGKKVLHLVRENHLAVLVSLQIAGALESFLAVPGPVPQDYKPVIIPATRIQRFSIAYRQMSEPWNDRQSVTYSDLLHKWPETIRRIQEYVGVKPLPLPQAVEKRVRKPFREVIINWKELEDAGYGRWLDGE